MKGSRKGHTKILYHFDNIFDNLDDYAEEHTNTLLVVSFSRGIWGRAASLEKRRNVFFHGWLKAQGESFRSSFL